LKPPEMMTPEELRRFILRKNMRLVDPDAPMTTCCICGKQFPGIGNNPEPYMSMGENAENECCKECEEKYVIPARIKARSQKLESDCITQDYIDMDEGDPNVYYSYKCLDCRHITKGHVFHMQAPLCPKCGKRMQHGDTERTTRLYAWDWFEKEEELETSYSFVHEMNLSEDDWDDDDVDFVVVAEVDGRRGIRVYLYDSDSKPLCSRFYYDDREMLQELLNR